MMPFEQRFLLTRAISTLAEGQAVVLLLPVTDKTEVAVFGLVGLEAAP
jgi:hypothetical protein